MSPSRALLLSIRPAQISVTSAVFAGALWSPISLAAAEGRPASGSLAGWLPPYRGGGDDGEGARRAPAA